jgi:hypothetical protein
MITSALAAWLAGSFAAQGAFNLALALAPISVIGLTSAMLVRPPRA